MQNLPAGLQSRPTSPSKGVNISKHTLMVPVAELVVMVVVMSYLFCSAAHQLAPSGAVTFEHFPEACAGSVADLKRHAQTHTHTHGSDIAPPTPTQTHTHTHCAAYSYGWHFNGLKKTYEIQTSYA